MNPNLRKFAERLGWVWLPTTQGLRRHIGNVTLIYYPDQFDPMRSAGEVLDELKKIEEERKNGAADQVRVPRVP